MTGCEATTSGARQATSWRSIDLVAEVLCEAGNGGVDDGPHLRRGAEHARHRRHTPVGDPARHDVTEHREVGVDVEGEAVPGAAPRDAHADRGDLLVADPHTRVAP